MSANDRVTALRQAFDAAFAAPPPEGEAAAVALLLVRIGGGRYAVRLDEVGEVVHARAVTPCPSGRPSLLGLLGHRDRIYGLFGLAELLGEPAGAAPWALVLPRGAVALAFEGVERYVQVAEQDLFDGGEAGGTPRRGHVREGARIGGAVRPVVSLASVERELWGERGQEWSGE